MRLLHVTFHGVRGESDDGDSGERSADLAGGFVAVHGGQGDVHEDEVGFVFERHTHALTAVLCDEQVVVVFQQLDEQVYVQFGVFNDQDGFHGRSSFVPQDLSCAVGAT